MAKIKLNPIVEEVSGGFGNIVFRASKGKTVMCRKPDFSNVELSDNQAEHRERFRQAVAYGRSVMADADLREFYDQAAERQGKPVFALTVADFFNAPVIHEMDLSAYEGRVGDPIKIKALDDFGVTGVTVKIMNAQGDMLIETGAALETATGSGQWVYTATVDAPAETLVTISAIAKDRPGGTAMETTSKNIS